MSAARNLPTEVLEKCFALMKTDEDGWQDIDEDVLFRPDPSLNSVLLTCKAWSSIAERLMYTSISLDKKFNSLYRSLENSRRADLVQKLRLYGVGCTYEELASIVDIINLCGNVTHLEIVPDGRYLDTLETDNLIEALAKTSLIQFKLRTDYHRCCLFSTNDVLSRLMANCWPLLEVLEVADRHDDDEDFDEEDMARFAECGGCPNLQIVKLDGELWHQQVEALSMVTKNSPLRKFEASIAPDLDSLPILHECAQRWGPTLQEFKLHFSSEWSEPPDHGALIKELPELTELSADARNNVLPSVLRNLGKVTMLEYTIHSIDLLDEFSEALACEREGDSFLPSIKEVQLFAEIENYRDEAYLLSADGFACACRSRGIRYFGLRNFCELTDRFIRFNQDMLHATSPIDASALIST